MDTYKKIFTYVPEKKKNVYVASILSGISAIFQIFSYWFMYKFLFSFMVKKDISSSFSYALIIVGFLIVYGLTYFSSLMASHFLAFRLESNLRKEGIKHLMKASFSFFDMNQSGRVRKIIDDNAAQTHMIVAHLIPDNISAVVTPICMLIVMFMVDYRLGILLFLTVIVGVIQVKNMMGNKDFMRRYMLSLEEMGSESVEYVRGMQVVKIFGATVKSFKRFYDSIVSYSKLAYEYTLSCRGAYVVFQVIMNIFIVFTLPMAIYFLSKGENILEILTKVVFFSAFAGILFSVFMKVMYVGMYNFQAKDTIEKLEKLFEDMKVKEILFGEEEKFENFNIEFKNLSFKYDEEYVIKNLNLTLQANKTYALVGSSGGGKSTLAKLISGFYKFEEGDLWIGGKSISSYSQKALMNHIAFVFQNAKLFKKSIYENVKIGNPNATYEEVMDALKKARCEDILDKFETREQTIIGSKGVYLSGGENQRIAIARAILKNASIIILDEASAAADPENEYEIQKAFSNLIEGKTVIMIAHRMSSIKNVDEILVIEEGTVIERGSHKQLMERSIKYRHLQELYSQANIWRLRREEENEK